mmetsp:Transcript_77847/g.146991  ORF Transcript_77847/g.146991 Transcript_77847/m.146991 type:complete len:530 (+) Transcript_77847:55-1644(+)
MQKALSPGVPGAPLFDPLMGSQRGITSLGSSLRSSSYPIGMASVPLLGSARNVVRAPSPPATVRTLATPGRSPSGSLAAPVHPAAGPYVGVAAQNSLAVTLAALKAANPSSPGGSVASTISMPPVSTPGQPPLDGISNGLIVRQATRESSSATTLSAQTLSRQSTLSKAAAPVKVNPSTKVKSTVKQYSGPGSPHIQYRPGKTTVLTSEEGKKQTRTLRVAYAPSRPGATVSGLSGSYAKAKMMPTRKVEASQYAVPKKAAVIQKPVLVTEKVEAAVLPVWCGSAGTSFAKAEAMPAPVVVPLAEVSLTTNGNAAPAEDLVSSSTVPAEQPNLYFIDNTHLFARTHGLSLRSSKSMEDKHMKLIQWGHAVHGVDEGDGWLNVNGLYLPFVVDGKPVIAKEQYSVCNRELGATTNGLAFRHSQDLKDKVEDHLALWGSRVSGVQEGDWLRVGDKYLPMSVNGVCTVRPAEVTMAPGFEELPEVTVVRIGSAAEAEPLKTRLPASSCFAGCGKMCSPSGSVLPLPPAGSTV